MKRAIIVHGWGASPEEGWRPWLRDELRGRGWSVSLPTMPDTEFPRKEAWVQELARVVGRPDAETFLVGHSLGCPAILRYLETLPKEQGIGGAVFVAGFSKPLGVGFEEIQPFVSDPFDWGAILSHCTRSGVILSDDDPLVPRAQGEELARHLRAKPLVIPGGKHFSGGEGTDTLRQLLDLLLEMAGAS